MTSLEIFHEKNEAGIIPEKSEMSSKKVIYDKIKISVIVLHFKKLYPATHLKKALKHP